MLYVEEDIPGLAEAGATNLTGWRHTRSWCPMVHGQEELETTGARFVELWSEGLEEILTHAVWWYVEATVSQSQDSKIVLLHSGLELLGWVELVERRGLISAGGFRGLNHADRLRLLLGHFRIPVRIPDELKALTAYAKARNYVDGPEAFYGMRNALVHPSVKKRDEVAQSPKRSRFEAAELGFYYLELILLAMLEHHGPILHRVSARWRGEEHPPPWVKPL